MSHSPSDIFLSYSRDDQAAARHFAEGFERAGFSVWWDVTLNAGEDYDRATERALRSAKAVVVLWSAKSVESRWVRTEATIALQCKTLVPVTIEACQRPIMFELTQTADLCHWSGDSSDQVWLTFLSDVQRFVQRGATTASAQGSAPQVSESPTLTPASLAPPSRRTAPASKTVAVATRSTSTLAWGLFALAVLIAAALAIPALQHLREEAPPELRFDIVTPATDFPNGFALSPDGRQVVYIARGVTGISQLWMRSLATATAELLEGTEGATAAPFWSPDSRSIGFFAGNALKRLDIGSGAPRTLASINNAYGGTWGADNTLVFAQGSLPLMRMSATGGEAVAVKTLERESSPIAPYFLPDGRRFLFYERTSIYLGNLDGSAPIMLTTAEGPGVLHPDGWLLSVQDGKLIAQRLDLAQAALTGEPLILADNVEPSTSVASNGLIAYRSVGSTTGRQLTWVDRTGTVLGTLGEPDSTMNFPRLSPDGRRVAVERTVQGNADIWLLDGTRSNRFTFHPAPDVFPLWSPDGSQIVYRPERNGASDLYVKPSSGAGAETLLVNTDQLTTPNHWSADGRFVLYHSLSPQTQRDLWAVPTTGDAVPFLVLQTPFNENYGQFSPDGRWVAYQSNESGRFEVYVRAFVAPDTNAATAAGGQWQISTEGGRYPHWSPDGQELYYLDPVGSMMAVSVTSSVDTIEAGIPELLFTNSVNGWGSESGISAQYDVAADGRFLLNVYLDEGAVAPITLIQNWNPDAEAVSK